MARRGRVRPGCRPLPRLSRELRVSRQVPPSPDPGRRLPTHQPPRRPQPVCAALEGPWGPGLLCPARPPLPPALAHSHLEPAARSPHPARLAPPPCSPARRPRCGCGSRPLSAPRPRSPPPRPRSAAAPSSPLPSPPLPPLRRAPHRRLRLPHRGLPLAPHTAVPAAA